MILKTIALTAIFLQLLALPSKSIWADTLPVLPEYLTSPFSDVRQNETFASAARAELFFQDAAYDLKSVHATQSVPQLYALNLPQDLNQLPVSQKTSLFIRLLLPSIVKVNTEIIAVRRELKILADKKIKGLTITDKEQQWLLNVAADHYGKPDHLEDLLARVDILPESLIMAQAIDESGWGTSRFAIMGNALFGQHLPRDSQGSFLSTNNGNVRVASFDNLFHSVASYIHNLNTTKAYGRLRSERVHIRKEHGKLTGKQLASALIHYSERGQQYVDTLRWLISHYRLDELDNCRIDDQSASALIKFQRRNKAGSMRPDNSPAHSPLGNR